MVREGRGPNCNHEFFHAKIQPPYLGAGDNGNVYGITNNLDASRSQSFTYDALNRVQTAQTAATWGNSYVYDPWGNLLQKNVTKGTSETLNVAVNGSNQIVGYCYDAAGNLINAGGCGATSYAYDAEGRMASAVGASYDYDGAGRRAKKSGGSNDTLYWYGQNGEVLLETDLAGNLQNEYIFFNGQRVARYDLYGYVDFYLGDHLGSIRLDTDVFGSPLDDSDYYPFGGERAALTNSSNHYKFTGMEHDSESGLDHTWFRQYSSTQGRWMTPDPAGLAASDPANPQSWNRYAYVMNNPVALIDPLGLGDCPAGMVCTSITVSTTAPTDPTPGGSGLDLVSSIALGWFGGGAYNQIFLGGQGCEGGQVPTPVKPIAGPPGPKFTAAAYNRCASAAFGATTGLIPNTTKSIPSYEQALTFFNGALMVGGDPASTGVTMAAESNFQLDIHTQLNPNGTLDIGPMQVNSNNSNLYRYLGAAGTPAPGLPFNGDPVANTMAGASYLKQFRNPARYVGKPASKQGRARTALYKTALNSFQQFTQCLLNATVQ